MISVDLEDGPCLGDCPLGEDVLKCKLAARRREQAKADRERWLMASGIPKRLVGAELHLVKEPVRASVAGFLASLRSEVQRGRGLIIAGPVGTGKSCILSVIGQASYDQGRRDLLMVHEVKLRDAFLGKSEGERALVDWARETELLLLDDWGTGSRSDWADSEWDSLFDERHEANLSTCVTTNLTIRQMAGEQAWRRILDRWHDSSRILELTGASRRGKGVSKP